MEGHNTTISAVAGGFKPAASCLPSYGHHHLPAQGYNHEGSTASVSHQCWQVQKHALWKNWAPTSFVRCL